MDLPEKNVIVTEALRRHLAIARPGIERFFPVGSTVRVLGPGTDSSRVALHLPHEMVGRQDLCDYSNRFDHLVWSDEPVVVLDWYPCDLLATEAAEPIDREPYMVGAVDSALAATLSEQE